MGFTTPRDWTVGETVTEDMMDEQVRDNIRYLKGLDGAPTIQSGLTIDNSLGYETLSLPKHSTAEIGTALSVEGFVAFDEQTHQMKAYDGTAVRAMISEADVDDTPVNGADTVPVSSNWAYDFQQTLTTAGDIPYASGAGVWTRLALGTGYLYSNGAALSYVAGVIPQYGIIIWTGTIANIPSGYVICDGNNSSPNLLTRFLEGVATAATDPGTTGGATAKTTAGHAHTTAFNSSTCNDNPTAARKSSDATPITSSSVTDGIADIRPLYYDVAFIMKT